MKTSKEQSDRFRQALRDPASVFADPADVLSDDALSTSQKIEVLRSWEYDARELLVAIEENMAPATDSDMFDRVIDALHRIRRRRDLEHTAPTKQGGIVLVANESEDGDRQENDQ